MKFLPDQMSSKDERSAIKVLIVFLLASLLTTLAIVYLVNLLLTGQP